MRYCKYCGNVVQDEAIFCRCCGRNLEKPKKNARRKIIMIVISLVLVAAILITTFWKPGFYWKIKYRNALDGMQAANTELSADTGLEEYFDAKIDPSILAQAEEYEPTGTDSAVVWSESEIAKGAERTAEVTQDSPIAEMDGVRVDFGSCNIAADSKVSVRIPESKSAPEEYLRSAKLYDLRLTQQLETPNGKTEEQITEFVEPVSVEVPYESSEDTYPVVQYYDQDAGRWEIVPFDLHEERGTLEFYVTHFSPYATFQYEIPKYDQLTPDLKLCVDAYKIISSSRQNSTLEAYINALQGDKEAMNAETWKTWIDQGNTCLSIGGIPISLGDLAKSTKFSAWSSGILGGIGAIISTYCVFSEVSATQSLPDALKVLLDHGFDIGAAISTMVGIGATIATKFTASALVACVASLASLAAVICSAMGIVMMIVNSDVRARYGGYENGTELAYRTFNKMISFDPYSGTFRIEVNHEEHDDLNRCANYQADYTPFCVDHAYAGGTYYYPMAPTYRLFETDVSWSRVMQYCKQKVGLEKALKKFEEMVDLYCDFFWQQSWFVKNTYFRYGYFIKLKNSRSVELYQEPYSHAEYTRRQKDLIMKACQPLIFGLIKEMVLEVRKKAHESVQLFTNEANAEITFELLYKDKKGNDLTLKDSPYKGKYIVLDVDPEKWDRAANPPWVVSMDQKKLFSCTYVAYTLAGEPERLLVYKDEEAYLAKEKPVATIPFTFERPKTVVRLDLDMDIFGEWDITMDVGELGSLISDKYAKMYIDAMKQQGVDVSEYEELYNELMNGGVGEKKGTMVIRDEGGGNVSVSITYDKSPNKVVKYKGTYDEGTRTLKMKNENPKTLEPEVSFVIQPNDPLTFATEVAYSDQLANFKYKLSGKKRKK